MTEIIKFSVDDVRFPTSKDLTGSDAVHTDPDYSATYVTVFTSDENLKGYGKIRIYGFLSERFMSYWFRKNTKCLTLPIIFYDIRKDIK